MKGILRVSVACAAFTLAGCVGYGAPGYGGQPGYGGGNAGGYYPGNSGYPAYPNTGVGGTVRCESDDGRTRYCDANTRGGVRLTKQLSRTDCIQGRNWGFDNRRIWVSQGCRGEFVTGVGGGYGSGYQAPGYGGAGQVVRCESQDGRYQHCGVRIQRGVEVSKQLSSTRCDRDRNWGWDRRGIWVKDGCRAEFRVY